MCFGHGNKVGGVVPNQDLIEEIKKHRHKFEPLSGTQQLLEKAKAELADLEAQKELRIIRKRIETHKDQLDE